MCRKNLSHHTQIATKTKPKPKKQPKTQTKACEIENPHTHTKNPLDKAATNNLKSPKTKITAPIPKKNFDLLIY